MLIVTSDIQIVGETESTLFEFINQGATDALLFVSNTGSNTMNYRFQQNLGGTWTDLVPNPDNDLYGTLMPGQTRSIKLTVSNPAVRLVGNASGGTALWFSVSRFAIRGDGGKLPILSF